jgi:predicted acylesterase/phospholipase RssA
LILQGGGALGAYEVGVFKAIYDKLVREEGDNAKENLFDIVAGASIEAINTPGELQHFWNKLTAQTWADTSICSIE